MFGSVLLRHKGVRGFRFGIGCSGVIQMARDERRQVGVGRIGVGTVTVCGPVRVKVGVKDNQTTNTQVTAIMRDVGLRNYGEFNEPFFCN